MEINVFLRLYDISSLETNKKVDFQDIRNQNLRHRKAGVRCNGCKHVHVFPLFVHLRLASPLQNYMHVPLTQER